jgi:hypothetical protein
MEIYSAIQGDNSKRKGNYSDDESFESLFNRTRRSAYARWLDDPKFNVATTLNFNSPITLTNARERIGRCFCKVDRKLLGDNFQQRPDLRVTGMFVFEHLESNLHAHGLLQVPPDRLGRFAAMFPETQRGIWTDVWPAGSQWTGHARDPAGFAFYIAKEQRASSAPETMLFLKDFFPTEG